MRDSQLRLFGICHSIKNSTSYRSTTSDIIYFKSFEGLKPSCKKQLCCLRNQNSEFEKPWNITGARAKTRTKQFSISSAGITLLFFLLSFCATLAPAAHAAEITLTWNANDPDPDGYNLYARIEGEEFDFDNPTWSGNTKSIVMENLVDGVTYYFIVRSFRGDVESSNSNELHYMSRSSSSSGSGNDIVVDNSDENATATGRWYVSAGKGPYAGQAFFSLEPGATYSYTSQISGSFEVALWWSYFGNRCRNVPVKIYDGNTLLDTVYVNQRKNSSQWFILGSYNFSGEARVEVVANNNYRCSTCADAVEFSKN